MAGTLYNTIISWNKNRLVFQLICRWIREKNVYRLSGNTDGNDATIMTGAGGQYMIPGGSIFPVRGRCFYRHHIINISIVMVKNRKAGQRSRRGTCRNCSGTKALQSCHDSRQDKNNPIPYGQKGTFSQKPGCRSTTMTGGNILSGHAPGSVRRHDKTAHVVYYYLG